MVRPSRGLTTSRFQRTTQKNIQQYAVFVHFDDPSARSKHQFIKKLNISKRNLVENWPTNQHQKLKIWETQKRFIPDLGIGMVTKILHFEVKSYFLTLLVDSGRSASASLVSKNIHFFRMFSKNDYFQYFAFPSGILTNYWKITVNLLLFFIKKVNIFWNQINLPPLLRLRQLIDSYKIKTM